jgi:hypothetical protein
MAEHVLRKQYSNHFGLDLKSSDLTRDPKFSSGMKNAQYRSSGSPEKRKGYQAAAGDAGGLGQWTYNRVNPTTGAEEAETITIDQNLFRVVEATLTVEYSGGNANARLSIYFDPTSAQYRCEIVEGTSTVLDSALGLGFDEASPKTLATLAAEIDALTGFNATVSGTSTTPAAFLEIVRQWDLSSGGDDFVGTARYHEQVNSTVSNPFSTHYGQRNEDDFENASAVQIQNCIYIGTGHDYTMKYDGQTVYRAGLPEPASLVTAEGAAGAITGSNYHHKAQYVQWDAAGNLIEGNLKTVASGLSPAAKAIDVTVANIQAGTGFNTNCAIVAGAQGPVNQITVDNGSGGTHTMKVGDTAYFYDSVSAGYVEREVTAISGTTITVAGAAVTVADNAVISNNLRIAVWRNKTSAVTPSIFYLVEEIPNNSFAATSVVSDNLADGSLGALLSPPATDRSPPPKGRYVSQWNGVMTLAGKHDEPNIFFFSDVDGPEYFPSDSNQLLIESVAGDKISGHAPNNEVYAVFKGRSFAVISGDIASGQVRVEIKSSDIGCVAHATIQEVDGVLMWLSARGPRYSTGGQIPRPLGEASDETGQPTGASRIDPVFQEEGLADVQELKLKRAIGVNDSRGKKYLLYLPAESAIAGAVYPNENSRIFAYDYDRDAWLEWSNMNMAGGVSILGKNFFFRERRYSTFNTSVDSVMYRRHTLEDAYDYADNNTAVGGSDDDAWEYSTHWETLGEPSVLKRFLLLQMQLLEEVANNDFDLTVVQETNYQADVAKAEFPLEVPGSGYGEAEYGNASYGDPGATAARHALFRDRVRSMRLRFRNSEIHQNVIITGIEVECATPYRTRIKS